MFTQDAEVLELGKGLIYRVVPFYITYIGLEIFNTVVRGCGDALFPVLLMLSGICALRIAWVIWVLPLSRSVYTLMWSYPVSWILTSAMFLIYYLHGGWLRRCQAKLKQKLTKADA
jgi:Na+-driven multidrug efflux pump